MLPESPPVGYAKLSPLQQQIDDHGYAVLHGMATGMLTECIAGELGRPISPWDGALLQTLTPRATSTPNTYSGNFGLGRFPFHTDLAHWRLPPRFLLLRCIRGYTDVPTLLLDGRSIRAALGHDLMARALVKPRRPQGGEIRMLRLLEKVENEEIIRWDEIYLKAASPIGNVAFDKIKTMINRMDPQTAVMTNNGDVMIVDNWRMLHARPAIPLNRRDRKLERVYLRSLK